ncbi:hypothetical protein ACI782_11295 [Geodermatophilus sp. SYSU D00703]
MEPQIGIRALDTSSMAVLVGQRNVAPSVASKAAVLGISEVPAAERARTGSRVGVTPCSPAR